MQIVWSLEQKDLRRVVAPIYHKPSASISVFRKSSTCRSRRVKIWTKEEISERNSTREGHNLK